MGGESGIPFGNYTLLRRIARGGMAEVFVARQKGIDGFDRLVAIKRILPHLLDDKSFVGMFQDEARLAARLSHPNVIHIYDFGKVEEHFFIAMQFMHGVHAGDLIRMAEERPMPAALVARIGADACAGLHYAHNRRDETGAPLKLVHRDVSPPNLLVSYDGVVKIVDFGIAKAVSSIEQTRPGVVKGKYAYMSPEQTMGQTLDGRSDVFSLGIVLWELLAGVPAVTRSDQVLAMKTIRDGKVRPVEDVRKDVPKALAQALRGALQKDPRKRSDARTFGNQLEAFIKGSSEIATSMELGAWLTERHPPEEFLGADKTGVGTRQATMATSLAPEDVSIHSAMLSAAHLSPPPSSAPRGMVSRKTPSTDQQETRVLAVSGNVVGRANFDRAASAHGSVLIDSGLVLPEVQTSTHQVLDATRAFRPVETSEQEELNFDDSAPTSMLHKRAPEVGTATKRLPTLSELQRSAPSASASMPAVSPVLTGPVVDVDAMDAPTTVDDPTPPPALEFEDTDRTYEDRQAPAMPVMTSGYQVAVAANTLVPPTHVHPPELVRRRSPVIWIAALGLALCLVIAALALNSQSKGSQSETADAGASAPPQSTGADTTQPAIVVTSLVDAGPEKPPVDAAIEPTEAVTPDLASDAGSSQVDSPKTRKRRKRRSRRNAAAEKGRLVVKTSPYSVVYHRGKRLGTTPMANLALPPGRYRLVFKNPNYAPVTRTAVIRSGETTKLDFALD